MEKLSDESVFRLKVAKSCCNAFSSIIMYPIHILNFLTDEFLYLSETKDFIGGYTSDDISGRGWKFFIDICIPQGRNVLSKAIVFADDFFFEIACREEKRLFDFIQLYHKGEGFQHGHEGKPPACAFVH